MPISITSQTIPTEQVQQAQDYIRQNEVIWSFQNASHHFLPLPRIKELATRLNIKAVSDQDPGFLRNNLQSNSRDFFINKVFEKCQLCFVATLKAGQDMFFLRTLMNDYDDDRLPVKSDHVISPAFQAGLDAFVGVQAAVCAPVLMLGDFDQQTPPFTWLPFVAITARNGHDAYEVEFHRGHLRSSVSASPDARHAGLTKFVMREFTDRAAAESHASWAQRQFGFVCGGAYYLCYH